MCCHLLYNCAAQGCQTQNVMNDVFAVVFKDSPSVCPSHAAVVASRLMSSQDNYCQSLRVLLHSWPFILLLVTYGQ